MIDVRQTVDRMKGKGWFIALSSTRDRSQVRGIGFDDKSRKRNIGERFRERGLLIGEHTSYAQDKAFELQEFLRLLRRAAKAMEHNVRLSER